MFRSKKIFLVTLSTILVIGCVLSAFIISGFNFGRGASPDLNKKSGASAKAVQAIKEQVNIVPLKFDSKGETVKKSAQKITGNVGLTGKDVKVTYKVYSEIDKGKLSFKGNAAVKGDTFTVDTIMLKPYANKIIITSTNDDGKTNKQTMTINYDSSSIKKVKASNIAKVDKDSDLSYVKNNLLVYFEENVSDAKRQEIINTVGGKCVGYVNGINMWQVEVKSSTFDDLKKMADNLTQLDEVFYASYNLTESYATMVNPSDPWREDYEFVNPSWSEIDPEGDNWSVEAVQALSAWDHSSSFNAINVGIVDGGFYPTQDDLEGKINMSTVAISKNVLNKYKDHGTHVSGIIGAIANNNIGVTGILYNTNSQLYCFPGLASTADIYQGFSETVESGAKVINFSIGLDGDITGYGDPSVNEIVRDNALAAEAAMTSLLANHDFIVVQAAGNSSRDAIYNGLFCSITDDNLNGTPQMVKKINDRIIIVGAAQRVDKMNFELASFSNAGQQVDICAPGYDVLSCIGVSNSYGRMSGTSMAAPMVTGITALTWSVNSSLTGAQVRNIVLSNTSYAVIDNEDISVHPFINNTYKMINAKLSVEAAIATKAPISYTALNTAVAAANALNPSLYTSASWANLLTALNSVNFNLLYINQTQINTYTQNINNAINALVLK